MDFNELETQTKDIKTHTHEIGVIQPPPDINAIIEKTSQFVALNGNIFEEKILAQNKGNTKFSFLVSTDPYHLYYKTKLTKLNESINPDTSEKTSKSQTSSLPSNSDFPSKVDHKTFIQQKTNLFQNDDKNFSFDVPSGLTMLELETIKLTAQFTARNGEDFLTQLFQREKNDQFYSFMRPNNSMFPYFTRLVDAYRRLIFKPTESLEKLKKDVEDRDIILSRCLNRLDVDNAADDELQEKAKRLEKEKTEMLSVEWHDFVVVETIEFLDDEDSELPVPLSLKDVILVREPQITESALEATETNSTSLNLKTKTEDEANTIDTKKVHSLSNSDSSPMVHIASGNFDQSKVVKNYARQVSQKDTTPKFVHSPLTDELISLHDIEEHIKTQMTDPSMRNRHNFTSSTTKTTSKASNDEIAFNISNLAKFRPDVFGSKPEEHETISTESRYPSTHPTTVSARPVVLAYDSPLEKNQKSIDHKENDINAPTPPAPTFTHRCLKTLEQHIPTTTKANEQISNSSLRHHGNIYVQVNCIYTNHSHKVDGPVFKLKIQSLETTINSLKDKLSDMVCLSSSKQKIFFQGIEILRDSESLAHYKITSE